MINKDTKIYMSASSNPTNFGANIYNKLFKQYDINAVYIPRKITDIDGLITSIKSLQIAGCSISMPFKSEIVKFLNHQDLIVKDTQMSNTIINNQGILSGYNTDAIGIEKCLSSKKISSVIIYGNGAICRTAIYILKKYKVKDIYIAGRNQQNISKVSKDYDVRIFTDKYIEYDMLLNTAPSNSALEFIPYVSTVFDVVNSNTELITRALKLNKQVIWGKDMYLYQIQKQFSLYTGLNVELENLKNIHSEFI